MKLDYRRAMSGQLRLLMLAPVPVLVVLAAAAGAGAGNGDPLTGMALIGFLALLPVGLAFGSRAFVRVRDASVTVGFWPAFLTRFTLAEVVSIELIQVDAWRSHRGWGIKGKPRSEQGLLYSAGGDAGIRFTLTDGRRYLVGCDHDDPAARRVHDTISGWLSASPGS